MCLYFLNPDLKKSTKYPNRLFELIHVSTRAVGRLFLVPGMTVGVAIYLDSQAG